MKKLVAAIVLFASSSLASVAAVEIQEVTSPGGIKAWLVEEHSIPFTALEIRFRGGSSLDRAGKRGETNLMMALIEEGAAELDSPQFAKARDALAASYEFDTYLDAVTISVRFLSENKDESVDLLRKALVETRFDEVAVERVKEQVRSVIKSNLADPGDIAGAVFYENAFGDHPYGSEQDGTIESVSALTRDDMFAARDRAMVKDQVYVGAVGDITAEELGEVLDTLLGDLPYTGPELANEIAPMFEGGIHVEPFDAPQSVVLFGHKGIKRDDPDFIAAYIANEVFGGSGEARLMKEVREKRGLTYGIGSYLVAFDQAEIVVGQFASGNEVVAEAIDVVKDEWKKLAEDGVTAEELELAKTYLTGSYALRFDGNGPIARILVGMQMEGLSTDYIETRNDLVNAITLDQINDVVARLYDPKSLSFVVVGQPEGL